MVSGHGFSASTKEIITIFAVLIGFILILPYLLKILIKSTADQAAGLIGEGLTAVNTAFSAPAETAARKATGKGYGLISPVTGLQVTKVYDYTDALRNLPPVQSFAVKTGEAVSSIIGVSPIETGAELRQEFEMKMAGGGQTEQFNALSGLNRMQIRAGEGFGNLLGFSPYQAGLDTRKFIDNIFGAKK